MREVRLVNSKSVDYTLYLVTDTDLLKGKSLIETVEEAIKGGVTLVQLREKDVTSLEFYNIAKEVKKVTDKYNVPLIINDRLDIALAIDAEGLHIGQSDLPCKVAREILPKGKILGVSAHTLEEALKAQEEGADYVGCGAMFSTSTKKDASNVSFESLKKIKDSLEIPVVAIGGINENNISKLSGTGIDGVAIVSAIIGKESSREAAEMLKKIFLK
ncbi:thiamine phosphate synthase [Clostridium sp. LP20]|uniref:thiamine phosphate synthase n=1 Tax=Clostridium sp. LP20 TaxID=3418665 RepID=UPI003EE5644B